MTATKARQKQATKTRKHEKEGRYASRTGSVLFAKKLDHVAAFYCRVLGLDEASRDNDHILLESPGFQLVVHRIPAHVGNGLLPSAVPARRASAAFKPVFFVQSLAKLRAVVKVHGGVMEPRESEWSFNGDLVCDALDPEGNVVQFRQTVPK